MGIFSFIKSVAGLAEDVIDIAIAPVEIATDITRLATKPIAETAQEVADEIKDEVDDA
jgi:hypothetical protein